MNPLNVANNFLQRAFKENISITPMKLQKLIYFLYAEYLAQTGMSLFGERFMVWKYGPVLQGVYDVFKKYGANEIDEFFMSDGNAYVINEIDSPIFRESIEKVWSQYKHMSASELSRLTHSPGKAWDKARNRDDQYLLDSDIVKDIGR